MCSTWARCSPATRNSPSPASAGTQIQLAHAEKLQGNGLADQSNLTTGYFTCVQTDSYICAGTGQEIWQPSFTVHSFRYVQVTGYAGGTPPLSMITGIITHTNLPSAGSFTCSDATTNRIVQNSYWSFRSNMQTIMNDCPGRERDGWTADAQVSMRALSYFFDVSSFMTKFMQDIIDGQSGTGAFPDTAPYISTCGFRTGSPGWGDAGIIIPWRMYQIYGDTRILSNSYSAMQAWMTYWQNNSTNYIPNIAGWGPEYYPVVPTDSICAGSAYYAYSAALMAKIATVLGHTQDAQNYNLLFTNIQAAILAKYGSADQQLLTSASNVQTQGAHTLHLMAGSLPLNNEAASFMASDITTTHNGNISTGLCGTPNIMQTLDRIGRPDLAFSTATITTGTSFGEWVSLGATSNWENWSGSVSLNHHYSGGSAQWFFNTLCGIGSHDPTVPGFTSLRMRPYMAGNLTSAAATFNSINGTFTSSWSLASGLLTWHVTIPPGSTATLWCPSSGPGLVLENGIPAYKSAGLVPNGPVSATYPTLENHFSPVVNAFPAYERFLAKSGTYVFTSASAAPVPKQSLNKTSALRRRH